MSKGKPLNNKETKQDKSECLTNIWETLSLEMFSKTFAHTENNAMRRLRLIFRRWTRLSAQSIVLIFHSTACFC